MLRPTAPTLALTLLLLTVLCDCKRSPGAKSSQPSGGAAPVLREALCLEQPDGCIYCTGRDSVAAPFLEANQSRPTVCDPKDEDNCIEFCTALAPECALPWSPRPRCIFDSELEFQRAAFNRDTSDRPEIAVTGRLVDDSGHRIEGAHIDVWVARGAQQTALAQEMSAKDGTFRIRLRSGPWTYSLRFSETWIR